MTTCTPETRPVSRSDDAPDGARVHQAVRLDIADDVANLAPALLTGRRRDHLVEFRHHSGKREIRRSRCPLRHADRLRLRDEPHATDGKLHVSGRNTVNRVSTRRLRHALNFVPGRRRAPHSPADHVLQIGTRPEIDPTMIRSRSRVFERCRARRGEDDVYAASMSRSVRAAATVMSAAWRRAGASSWVTPSV